MKVIIKMLTGYSFTINELKPSDTIQEVKGRIYEAEGFVPASQRLADPLDGTSLANDGTLDDICITDNDTMYLLVAVDNLEETSSADMLDWRKGKTAAEMDQYVLETGINYDVLIEAQREDGGVVHIKAHRSMLMKRSAVLDLLCKPCAGQQFTRVQILDVPIQTIWKVLRFIYYGSFEIDSGVIHILMAAKKFQLYELSTKCTEYMYQKNDFSPEDQLVIFDTAIQNQMEAVENKMILQITSAMQKYTSLPAFLGISQVALNKLLNQDVIAGCTEVELFQACVRWAKAKCQEQGKEATDAECRAVLGDTLHLIRFPTMEIGEFTNVASGNSFLTDLEKLTIFEQIGSKGRSKFDLPYPTKKRLLVVEENPRGTGEPVENAEGGKDNGFSPENELVIFDTAIQNQMDDTANKYLLTITSEMRKYISLPAFLGISQVALNRLLEQDTIAGCTEVELFEACVRWAKAKCDSQGNEASDAACRAVLGDTLHLIRFPTMEMEEFTNMTLTTSILSDVEKLRLFKYIGSKGRSNLELPYSAQKRGLEINRNWSGDGRLIANQIDRFGQGSQKRTSMDGRMDYPQYPHKKLK